MEVIAFVGPSGTGKSHRAQLIAHENDIPAIIDDGLLIYANKIVAGKSAKKEESRLKAVRRAIFQDRAHVADVKGAIDRLGLKKILIIGTSENMVQKITKALAIPSPHCYIRIEDVATPKEIEKAQYARLKEGKHIIPVPVVELKPHFKGYVIDPIVTMWKRGFMKKKSDDIGHIGSEGFERSVVRPSFSYYGRLTFSDHVIIALIRNSLSKVEGAAPGSTIRFKRSSRGHNGLDITLHVMVYKGRPIKDIMQSVQKVVVGEIDYITGMSVEKLVMDVKEVVDSKRKLVQ